jgi:hypothetical protein
MRDYYLRTTNQTAESMDPPNLHRVPCPLRNFRTWLDSGALPAIAVVEQLTTPIRVKAVPPAASASEVPPDLNPVR